MEANDDRLLEHARGLVTQIDSLTQGHLEWVKLSSSHFERLIVLNGAALALSFTASATLRTLPHEAGAGLHLRWLLSAWLVLIVSIVAALVCNLFLLSSHDKVWTNATTEALSIRFQMMGVAVRDDAPEKAARLKKVYEELPHARAELAAKQGKRLGKVGWAVGLIAQAASIAGLTCLAVYFVKALR